MPPLSISEVRDALAVLGVLAGLVAGGVAGYCGITNRLNDIAKELKRLAGDTTGELKALGRRVTELERRERDLQVRPSYSHRRRDTASD